MNQGRKQHRINSKRMAMMNPSSLLARRWDMFCSCTGGIPCMIPQARTQGFSLPASEAISYAVVAPDSFLVDT